MSDDLISEQGEDYQRLLEQHGLADRYGAVSDSRGIQHVLLLPNAKRISEMVTERARDGFLEITALPLTHRVYKEIGVIQEKVNGGGRTRKDQEARMKTGGGGGKLYSSGSGSRSDSFIN